MKNRNKVNQKTLVPVNATKPQATLPTAEGQVETAPAAIGVPEDETPEALPPVEDVEVQEEKEKTEKTEGEKKDGRGRPQGMICSFPLTVGEILAECPELKSMWHVVSEKQERTEDEKRAMITERLASGAPLDAEFLGNLMSKEIGENLQLQGREKEGEFVPGYLEKQGADFKITVTRGQIKKYFDDRAAGVFARLTAKIASKEAAAAGATE